MYEDRYAPDSRRPAASRNSVVLAGWICVFIGLLSAWLLPLGQIFFSVAFIMAVIALATHQVRQGLALLAGALFGSGLCVLIFFVLAAGAASAVLNKAVSRTVPPPASPSYRAFATPPALSTAPPPAPLPVAARPLLLREIKSALRMGSTDDEIIADAADKQIIELIGAPDIGELRSLGAGNRLIEFLQTRRLHTPPRPPVPPARAQLRPPPAMLSPAAEPFSTPGLSVEQKDRRVAALKSSIDQLDEQIRRARDNPRLLGTYLEALDRQRNDLRREKWKLEGR